MVSWRGIRSSGEVWVKKTVDAFLGGSKIDKEN